MWVKQRHKPPMTGNGNHTTYNNGDDWGMVYDIIFTNIIKDDSPIIDGRIPSYGVMPL